jgi:predicted nucleic acid-binding protein
MPHINRPERGLSLASAVDTTWVEAESRTALNYMTAPTFVDSIILIYVHDLDAGAKHMRAAGQLTDLWNNGNGILSTQVLQEFYVNVTQKIRQPLSRAAAREIVRDYIPWIRSPLTGATVVRASEISEVWQISFWDAMIVAAAEQSGAAILLTEDLNDGQIIAGVRIQNPFQ